MKYHVSTPFHGDYRIRWGLLLVFFSMLFPLHFLLSCDRKPDPHSSIELMNAISHGNDTMVRDALKKGVDINARSDGGCTPIISAIEGGYLSTVRLLMERGADINATCNNGTTPLMHAAAKGNSEIVGLLLANGVDVNSRKQDGLSALTFAIHRGHTDIARSLLEKGAYVNFHIIGGETPLIMAVRTGNEAMVRMLLEKGADVRERDEVRAAPLDKAIEMGNTGIVQLLIGKGADLNTRAGDGYTPIARARTKKLDAIVSMLLAAGAQEPEDPGKVAADNYRAKKEQDRREIENRGLEFIDEKHELQTFVKPASISRTGSDTVRATIWEYYCNSDELEEINLEVNCNKRTYRYLSCASLDLSGKVLNVTPGDNYTLYDGGKIQYGTTMDNVLTRVCLGNHGS